MTAHSEQRFPIRTDGDNAFDGDTAAHVERLRAGTGDFDRAVLEALRESGEQSLRDLGAKLAMDHTSLNAALRRLRAMKLVYRHRPSDRRHWKDAHFLYGATLISGRQQP